MKNIHPNNVEAENISFNTDISKWNLKEVKPLDINAYIEQRKKDEEAEKQLLAQAPTAALGGDISNWDTSRIQDMKAVFKEPDLNTNISNWDTESVKSLESSKKNILENIRSLRERAEPSHSNVMTPKKR